MRQAPLYSAFLLACDCEMAMAINAPDLDDILTTHAGDFGYRSGFRCMTAIFGSIFVLGIIVVALGPTLEGRALTISETGH